MTLIMRISTIVAGLLFWAVAGEAGAESFSLSDIYQRVQDRNEEIKMAQETVRQAEEEKGRARSSLLPRVTLSGSYTYYPEETVSLGGSEVQLQPEKSYGIEATVSQSLFEGGRNMASFRMARRELEIERKNLALSTEDLLLRTADVFYRVLKTGKDVEAQQRNVERLLEHRRISELRFNVGEVTETVLLRAEAELAGARAELVARENELAVSRKELRILADLPEGYSLDEPPLPEAPGESEAGLMETALMHREDMRRSALRERAAKDAVAMARGNFLPKVTLEGTYFNRDQDPKSTFFIDESWFVGGRVEFPIFEGGLRKAEYSQARSRFEQDRLATFKLRKDVDLDVTSSRLTLKAISRVLESRKDQVRFAAENYEVVSRQFTFGLATNIDLLDANQTLIEAERDVIAASYDRHLAILDLQRSVGLFMKNALTENTEPM